MEHLIDDLILERLCVNKNKEINYDKKGSIKSNICKCNLSNHIACVFYKKNRNIFKIHTGINNYININHNQSTVHAEISALNKLKNKNSKKCKKINLLVIKVSYTGKVGNSKPCIKCVEKMYCLPIDKGYSIKNVYYSDENGQIIKNKIQTLINDDEKHLSRYYKRK